MQSRYKAMIRESLNADDREFCRTAPKELMPEHIKRFYEMIEGGPMAMVKYYVSLAIHVTTKIPKRRLLQWIIKLINQRLKTT
jgi:hypothetical protein